MRIVPCPGDERKLGTRNEFAIGAAIGRRHDAVVLAPHEQSGDAHAMKPPFQLAIVQARVPAQAGKGFVVAGDDGELALWHCREIALALFRVEPLSPAALLG